MGYTKGNSNVERFDSISDFYKAISTRPYNAAFSKASNQYSTTGNIYFTGTESYIEAQKLLQDGWTQMSERLTQQLKATNNSGKVMQQRNVISVAGYQPIVPLYLIGVPTNMITKQMVAVKSKVLTVSKLVNYKGSTDKSVIEEESIKALRVVRQLEQCGYRVNLNVVLGSEQHGTTIVCSVRIKNANEKLNISKVSFPMVHPSMLRRLFFRYIETHERVTPHFVNNYGAPIAFMEMKKLLQPEEIVLPSIWDVDVDKVKDLDSLVAMV